MASEPVSGDGIVKHEHGNDPCAAQTPQMGIVPHDDVFKVAGGGQNLCPTAALRRREMLGAGAPTSRWSADTWRREMPGIALVSMVRKIINKITILDFIQSEPVSDVVKPATYRLFFLSEDNERISNENSYIADSRDQDAQKRIFRMKFQFKDKKVRHGQAVFLCRMRRCNRA